MDPKSRIYTTVAFRVFDGLTNTELHGLLLTAGVVPYQDRSLMLQQALIVWFHGDIPSIDKFLNLIQKQP